MKTVTKCPYCDCTDLMEGIDQTSSVSFGTIYAFRLVHLVCVNCGSVVQSKVKNLPKLQKTYNSKNRVKNSEFVFNK